jgi:hypothetical protein
MAEYLASLQAIDERKDGGFVGDPFAGVLHIQPSCRETSGGLVLFLPALLEVSNVVRSLIGALKVFSERNLHVEPCLDGVLRQVIVDSLPHGAR